MDAYLYPAMLRHRRHGPRGYLEYESYRPWLRDEFDFRCIYCLRREQWDRLVSLQIDHFEPTSQNPATIADYQNLFYSCTHCNQAKGSRTIANPMAIMRRESVTVQPDGQIVGHSDAARQMIAALRLNNEAQIQYRRTWLDILSLARRFQPTLYRQLLGYPLDLPNLESLHPPGGNSRPEGIAESHYARRERGELPDIY